MEGIPARPPGGVHFSAAAAAANAMASRHVEARADRKGIGAVEDIAGARGVDDSDGIGGAALQAAVLVPAHALARRA